MRWCCLLFWSTADEPGENTEAPTEIPSRDSTAKKGNAFAFLEAELVYPKTPDPERPEKKDSFFSV